MSIFLSYSRTDMALVRELERHLKRIKTKKEVSLWIEDDLGPNSHWIAQMVRHVDRAQIILLLLSPEYLESEFIHSVELPSAIARGKEGSATVIPILLRPCNYGQEPSLTNFLVLPSNGRPVIESNNRDEAFFDIARRIGALIDGLPSKQNLEAQPNPFDLELIAATAIDKSFEVADSAPGVTFQALKRMALDRNERFVIAPAKAWLSHLDRRPPRFPATVAALVGFGSSAFLLASNSIPKPASFTVIAALGVAAAWLAQTGEPFLEVATSEAPEASPLPAPVNPPAISPELLETAPPKGTVAIDRETLHREGFYPEESSGLFVGISRFEDERLQPIHFAVDDAVDLAWVFSLELGLVEAKNCVLALAGEPRKDVSRQRLDLLLSSGARIEQPTFVNLYQSMEMGSRAGGSRGLFICTVATHGLSSQGNDFLLATDSVHRRPTMPALAVQDLFSAAASATALQRILLIDSARVRLSDSMAFAPESQSSDSARLSQMLLQAADPTIGRTSGLAVLFASTAGGHAYDDFENGNGVFTGALIEGLLGLAPTDGRGFITTATLAAFANAKVRDWIERNRPHHMESSRGIEWRFDGTVDQLPLAIPTQSQAPSLSMKSRSGLERKTSRK